MKIKNLFYTSIAALALLFPGSVLAASSGTPSISTATIERDIISISGFDFGNKPTPGPIRFETSEGYTVGKTLPSESGWWTDRGASYQQSIISSTNQRHSNSTRNIESYVKGDPPFFWKNDVGFADTGKIFVSFWLYVDWGLRDSATDQYQIKISNYSEYIDGSGGGNGASTSLYAWWYPGSPGYSKLYNTSGGGSLYWQKNTMNENHAWYNVVHVIDMGTTGGGNGKFYGYIGDGSGYTANSENGTGKSFITSGESKIDAIKLFNYLDKNDNPGFNFTLYYDDIYVDNSWARVELGDSPDYYDCNRREMQIPTHWSDTSIRVNINKGSFSGTDDELYLFVVNSNGVVSEGFSIDSDQPDQLVIRPLINSIKEID